MKSEQKSNNNILLGRVKIINPVNQRKGDVVKIASLLDCIYDEQDVKKVATQTYESNGATTSQSKKGKFLFLFTFLELVNGHKLDRISELDCQQEYSFNDYKIDYSKRLCVLENKNDAKSINKDEDNDAYLNNSGFIDHKSSNPEIRASISDKRKKSLKNFAGYNLYPYTVAKSYLANDLNNPFIYSRVDFQPISFLSGQNKFGFRHKTKELEIPSPVFIEYKEFISKITQLKKETIFNGTRIDDKLGIVLIDKNICQKFKGIVGKIMKSLIMSLFTRKPVSLPVRIFEPKSTLQRITESWAFAPKFLVSANENNNFPLERMKHVMCFAIGGLCLSTRQLKPFNPMLGETFQGFLDQNTMIYIEHISHYPTICRFLMIDQNKKYKFHGFYDFLSKPKAFGSKLIVIQKGPNICEFENGEKVIYNLPKVKLLNCKSEEDRSTHYTGQMIFVDVKNNMKGCVFFAKNKKKVTDIHGYIQKFVFPKDYIFNIEEEIIYAKNKKNYTNILCAIKGNWIQYIDFDDKNYWHIDKFDINPVLPIEHPLPSDGRFREDLIWLFRCFYANNEKEKNVLEEYSQSWKLLTELAQRNDRDMRKNAAS